jgi:cytochrome o ubiquinol oxidase subunit 1
MTHEFIFGRLAMNMFPQNDIALFGALTVVVGIIGVLGAITYFNGWRWIWKEYLTSLDPKRIGVLYLFVSAVMLARGGFDALLLRTQQATSVGDSTGILSAAHFQEIFSAHGSIMIFFVAMGFMFGLINIVLPLLIGARDVAFPYLNSVSFWLFFAGAALINMSLIVGDFSAAGWLSYPPLSELQFSPTTGVDYWIWALQISGIGSLLSGVNFLTTIITKRARGMTPMKMPMFVWTVAASMALVCFAFPVLTATLGLLSLDRLAGMHFFTAGGGGNMMMYVNLIWAWGHPEVYILILPAFGVFSEIVPVFARKKLAGYGSMALSIGAIAFLSWFVWLHHFFTMGAGANINAFFGIMTAVIAIPTGVKLFNWIFTLYRGRIRFTSPMLWFMGFVVLFTMGGVAGVVLSEPPADFQLHNSLFLVAHFHTMIVSGVLFGYFAGLTYWFPKIFGFKLDEKWGIRAFWFWLVGFILAFTPLYILGFMGATRRLDHYDASLGWQPLFLVAGIGAICIAIGFACQIAQIASSVLNRRALRDLSGDPWDGRTLEWSVASPAPSYNFARLPLVSARDQYWEMKERGLAGAQDLRPYEDIEMPKNSMGGLVVGASAFLCGFGIVWHVWWLVVIGFAVIVVTLVLRSFDDETEYTITAAELAKMDAKPI